jgi:hypothetical protein
VTAYTGQTLVNLNLNDFSLDHLAIFSDSDANQAAKCLRESFSFAERVVKGTSDPRDCAIPFKTQL